MQDIELYQTIFDILTEKSVRNFNQDEVIYCMLISSRSMRLRIRAKSKWTKSPSKQSRQTSKQSNPPSKQSG